MLAAVQFDHQLCLPTGEVRKEGADGKLADEFSSFKLTIAELRPQALFHDCGVATQFSRTSDLRFVLTPHAPSITQVKVPLTLPLLAQWAPPSPR